MKSNRIVFAFLLAGAPLLAYADGGPHEFHYDAAYQSTRSVAEVRAEALQARTVGEAGESFRQWSMIGTTQRTREEVKRELATMPAMFQGA